MLLVKEAGGMVTDFSGKPYHPGDREMLASNRNIHSETQAAAADIGERNGQAISLDATCVIPESSNLSHKMELFLNLLWLLIAAGAVGVWRTRWQRQNFRAAEIRSANGRRWVARWCCSFAVSLTDDLHTAAMLWTNAQPVAAIRSAVIIRSSRNKL